MFIYPNARLENPSNISLGSGSVIANAHLLAAAKIQIGERTLIGDGVYLCAGTHDIYSDEFTAIRNPIVIGNNVWVATGATVMPGVRIGDNAVVAAKAVVFRDVPAGTVAVGNPATIMNVRREVTPAFKPLALTNIDYENSSRRLLQALRQIFSAKKADSPTTEDSGQSDVIGIL